MTLTQQLSFDAAIERDADWSLRARTFIERMGPGSRLNSDALRLVVGDPVGTGCSVGAVIHQCEKAGLIRYTGQDTRSSRPAARGRWLRVWERTSTYAPIRRTPSEPTRKEGEGG